MDSHYGDLLYYTEVRWFSRGVMLRRFYELREEVFLFMEEKSVVQLKDTSWISDLAFLFDITQHLNTLNTKKGTPAYSKFV